jgi:transposase-like protein
MIVDPATAFCPNMDCPARGRTGKGNVVAHSRKDKRHGCRQCRKTFAASTGTPFHRLHKPADLLTLVVALLARGCPLQAIVVAFSLDERTAASWFERSAAQCQAAREHLVEQPRQLGQVQADELRVKIQGGVAWVAMALMVQTRPGLGGQVSRSRDPPLIRRLMERVRRRALFGRILVRTDGLCSHARATREAFRDKTDGGKGGGRLLVVWPRLLIAQVVKRHERRRVAQVERRAVHGEADRIEKAREASSGQGVINTAYIERLNGTFRERLGTLARRTRALARATKTLEAGMWLVGTVHNFRSPHASLRRMEGLGVRLRTPAMAAGITRRVWSVPAQVEVAARQCPAPCGRGSRRWKAVGWACAAPSSRGSEGWDGFGPTGTTGLPRPRPLKWTVAARPPHSGWGSPLYGCPT